MRIDRLVIAAAAAFILSAAARAQDHNYVPGWVDTYNHRYKGETSGKWKAKTELLDRLSAAGPEAQCTLRHLSEPDGNVIVNRYRSIGRQTNERAAFRWAQTQVAMHHRTMKSTGTC